MNQLSYLDGVHPRLINAFEVLEQRLVNAYDYDQSAVTCARRELIVGAIALAELCKTESSKRLVGEKIGFSHLDNQTKRNLVTISCASIDPAGVYPPDAVLLGLEEQSLRATLAS